MAEINRAYDVLGRSASRREYDRSLHPNITRDTGPGDPPATVSARVPADLATSAGPSDGPARMPWKLMAVAAVLGSLVVLVSAALTGERRDEPPDGILRIGSCVEVLPSVAVREVSCADDDSLVVRLVLPTGSRCPTAYMGYRDRLGLGTACVEATG